MTFKRKAVPFDTFVGGCNYFDGNSDVNNGYGCTHPEQEEKQKGKGCCFCFSCPLGTPADEESFEEPDINWNGTEKEDVGEDDYIIIPSNCENQNLVQKGIMNWKRIPYIVIAVRKQIVDERRMECLFRTNFEFTVITKKRQGGLSLCFLFYKKSDILFIK